MSRQVTYPAGSIFQVQSGVPSGSGQEPSGIQDEPPMVPGRESSWPTKKTVGIVVGSEKAPQCGTSVFLGNFLNILIYTGEKNTRLTMGKFLW